MRPVREASYKAAPLPKHRIKMIDGEQHVMLDMHAAYGHRIVTRRKIGILPKGTVLKVQAKGIEGVKAYTEDGSVPYHLRHSDYRVLRKMTEPRPLPVTVYGKGNCEMLEQDGAPTFNTIYDHTLIDMTSIAQDAGHTLVIKLPGDQYVTLCPMYNSGTVMIDMQAHGSGKQEMLIMPQGKAAIRHSESLYCLELNRKVEVKEA